MTSKNKTSIKIANANSQENRPNVLNRFPNRSHRTITRRSKSVFAVRSSTTPTGSSAAMSPSAEAPAGTTSSAQQ